MSRRISGFPSVVLEADPAQLCPGTLLLVHLDQLPWLLYAVLYSRNCLHLLSDQAFPGCWCQASLF